MRKLALALSMLLALLALPSVSPAAASDESGGALPARLKRLAESKWQAIPGSEMNSVFVPGVDKQPWMRPGSWPAIQAGWSGAVCTGKELVLWGGGHSNGNHNGLLAVTPDGHWRRITEPSPVWTPQQCPGGTCPAVTGPCPLNKCNTGPDGRPVSRHTYSLLGYHDGAIYSVTGATAPSGAPGDPPRVWRFVLADKRWEPLPETPVPLADGSIVIVGDRLYQAAGWKGMAVLDLKTLKWEKRELRHGGFGGPSGMVYVPTLDRIYFVGDGHLAWVARAKFGIDMPTAVARRPGDEVIDGRYLGLAYDAADDAILAWNGGRTLAAIDPHTNTVTPLALAGDDPGPALKNGTFGRLSECGGRLMLVNGVDRPLYVLAERGAAAPAAVVQTVPAVAAATASPPPAAPRAKETAADDEDEAQSAPPGAPSLPPASTLRAAPGEPAWRERERLGRPAARGRSMPQAVAGGPALPQTERLRGGPRADREPGPQRVLQPASVTDPYFPTPPGGSLAAFDQWVDGVCGPRSQWTTIDVGPGYPVADAADVRVGAGERVVIRLHPSEAAYGRLLLMKARCVEVDGIPDAQGQRPTVTEINMTRGFAPDRPERQVMDGGLIIRNVHVRGARNDCIGSPNDGRFLSIEDSLVEDCGHHGVITGRSPQFYFRSLRTTWRYADSHLVYINRIARSDLIDNVCEAPGWGHCLRSLARVNVMTGNRVSNVALDGSIPPAGTNPTKPKRVYFGMHPVDVYGCSDGLIANNTITYYHKARENIPVPINVRYRPGMMGCDIAEHDDKAWKPLDPMSPEFQDPATWARIRAAGDAGRLTLTVRDNVIRIFGPDRTQHQAVGVQGGSLPLMGGQDRRGLQQWAHQWYASTGRTLPPGEMWAAMRAAMPDPHWQRIADLILPDARHTFLTGDFPNNMPLPIPVGRWFQRQTVEIGPQKVSECDDGGHCVPSTQPLLRPEPIDFIYFGEPDPAKQFAGPNYRRAIIEMVK